MSADLWQADGVDECFFDALQRPVVAVRPLFMTGTANFKDTRIDLAAQWALATGEVERKPRRVGESPRVPVTPHSHGHAAGKVDSDNSDNSDDSDDSDAVDNDGTHRGAVQPIRRDTGNDGDDDRSGGDDSDDSSDDDEGGNVGRGAGSGGRSDGLLKVGGGDDCGDDRLHSDGSTGSDDDGDGMCHNGVFGHAAGVAVNGGGSSIGVVVKGSTPPVKGDTVTKIDSGRT